MSQRKRSIFNALGWGLLGDAFLFMTALIIAATFAISSLSVAYVISFAILMLLLSALYIFKRTRKK